MLLPSPHPQSWFVFLQAAAAFVKYPPVLKGKGIFQAFWGMSYELETAALALGRPHCHLLLPLSHRCLRPVFDLDKVQFSRARSATSFNNFFEFGPRTHIISQRIRSLMHHFVFLSVFSQEVHDTKLRNGPNPAHCAPLPHFLTAEKSLCFFSLLCPARSCRDTADFPLCRFPTSPALYPLLREDR